MGKILLAEDDHILRSMLVDSFEQFGHEVKAAENGEIAWDLWNSEDFDILVTDINMPKMNGITLLKNIRDLNASFPVVIITGVPLESAETQAHEYGASAILYKPFKMKALFDTINKLLID